MRLRAPALALRACRRWAAAPRPQGRRPTHAPICARRSSPTWRASSRCGWASIGCSTGPTRSSRRCGSTASTGRRPRDAWAGCSGVSPPTGNAVAAIRPWTQPLRSLHAGYAATYVLENAHLEALSDGIAHHRLEDLPDTQARQRAAIVRWRVGVTAMAADAGAPLPPDLQHAGRGEIAPSPNGS